MGYTEECVFLLLEMFLVDQRRDGDFVEDGIHAGHRDHEKGGE
jgi:hypothetical protein